VAITGAREFPGAGLVRRLDADPEVRAVVALDGAPPGCASDRVRAHDIDIAGPGADGRIADVLRVERVEAVVHTACFVSSTHQLERMHELESTGTLNLLAACAGAPVRRLCLWSHTHLYGARPDNPALLVESRPLRAPEANPFFRDKLQMEQQVASVAERRGSLAVTVLRSAPAVGPNARGVVTSLLRHRAIPLAAGYDPLVQVVHEYDLLDAFLLALRSEATGTFNIVGGGVLPLSTAVLVAGRLPVPVPPSILRRTLAVLWAMRAGEFGPDLVDWLMYPCVADGARASRELGFRPSYSTQEALFDHAGRFAPGAESARRPSGRSKEVER
jgi:UDP-glucose 4-epimerase